MSQLRFLTHRKSVGDRLLRVLMTSPITTQLEFFNLICECEAMLGVGDRDSDRLPSGLRTRNRDVRGISRWLQIKITSVGRVKALLY